MTVRTLFWAILEIGVDILLLYIVLSNSTAATCAFRRYSPASASGQSIWGSGYIRSNAISAKPANCRLRPN